MADQPSRKRRIVKSAILVLAGLVLLVGYVEGFRLYWWCEGYGATVSPYLHTSAAVSFAPLNTYSQIPFLPGAVWLRSEMVAQLKEGRAAARKELEERHAVRTISD
jgi:hypothetical protein